MSNDDTTVIRRPGWYPDEERPGQERFWTGAMWGASTRPIGFTPMLPPELKAPGTDLRSDLRPRRSALGKRLAWIRDLFSS